MAHEQIIRNGLIIENTFSFLDNHTVVITGITTTGPLVDRNHIVTETAIKTTIESIELSDLSGVNFGSANQDDILIYNGSEWVTTAKTSINSDYYTKTETDAKFVYTTGDTMTGDLTMNGGNIVMSSNETVDGVDISQFKNDFDQRSLSGNTDVTITTPTNNQLLQYNGTNWVNVDASSVVTDSYTKAEADNKFVYTTGDTMSGELKINIPGGTGNRALTTQGDAYIMGNLYVSGETTVVNVENMAISDNLLLLNSGETGAGVSRGVAGFLVDRGTKSAVTLMFDETSFTVRVGETTSSLFSNTIDTSHTVALATILDYAQMQDYGFTFYQKHSATNGILMNLTGFTTDGNNLLLNGSNIIMNGNETVDGVDISQLKSDYDTFTGITYPNRTLNDISDVNVSSPSNNDIIAWNSATTQWELTTISNISGDFYTKTESDARYVNVSGDIMTGNLTVPSLTAITSIVLNNYTITDILDEDNMSSDSATALATQQSIKAYIDNLSIDDLTDVNTTTIVPQTDDILVFDGSNWVNTASTSILSDYYTKTESDARYVNVNGDTMTGDLTMGSNNIIISGLVDGVDISQLKSDYDTFTGITYPNRTLNDISDVTITSVSDKDVIYYDNTSSKWINGDLNTLMDNTYVNVTGDTMTGDLTITPLSGTGNRLVYVDLNGKLQESDEYVYKTATTGIGSGDNICDSFNISKCKGVTWDYVATSSGDKYKAGTITATWTSDGTTVEYNEVSTNTINGSWFTGDIDFKVDYSSSNIRLIATAKDGDTWTLDTSRQMMG